MSDTKSPEKLVSTKSIAPLAFNMTTTTSSPTNSVATSFFAPITNLITSNLSSLLYSTTIPEKSPTLNINNKFWKPTSSRNVPGIIKRVQSNNNSISSLADNNNIDVKDERRNSIGITSIPNDEVTNKSDNNNDIDGLYVSLPLDITELDSNKLYTRSSNTTPIPFISSDTPVLSNNNNNNNRLNKFKKLLTDDKCDINNLRKLCWNGIPSVVRREVWQLLFNYIPLQNERRSLILSRKRNEYNELIIQHPIHDISSRTETESAILHQILLDVPRTYGEHPFFKTEIIQKSLTRILYIWSVRHPASGYVQGMNDLITPFLVVFYKDLSLNDWCDVENLSETELINLEADSFWCFTKLLDGIQDNYIYSQPGIQRNIYKLRELVNRIDGELCSHIEKLELQFIQFAFRWMNNLLMREIPFDLILRLWDTYISEEEDGFAVFHLYVCCAFLMMWKKDIMSMDFQDLVVFIQHLPTDNWTDKDIESLVSQAFVYKTYYHYAPSHLH